MRLTVAICTWNRCQLLQQALEQMILLRIPHGLEWEVLIVNNGSTDLTDQVIAGFSSRLPVRRLYEPKPGLSNARNRAVYEARGEYIIWTDDDALVETNWLLEYVRAFEQWPEAAFFGGPIAPFFAVTPPDWLAQAWSVVADAYAVREQSDQPIRLDTTEFTPYGANFAVRTKEQRTHPYDASLGHRRQHRIGGEETKLLCDLVAEGHHGRWIPGASVRHYIAPERMSLSYIQGYFFGNGQRLALTSDRHGLLSKCPQLWSAMRKEVKYRWHRHFSPPKVWMRHFVSASKAWGRLRLPDVENAQFHD